MLDFTSHTAKCRTANRSELVGPKVISEQKFPMQLHKLNMNMQHSTLGDRTSEKISNLSDVILLISGKAGIHT